MAIGVTVCVVARNEEAVLGDCLASVRDVADAILVLDHGSTDGTATVARAHGARVLGSNEARHEMARNAYLEEVATPWVLVLDADERLSETANVAALVRGAPSDVLGFAIERFDYVGRGRWASTRLVRLFRSHPKIRYFASEAHAAVAPAIAAMGGTIALAHAPVHHLDALLARDHVAKRANMRARLEREIAGGAHAIMRCFLALEHFAVGDDDASSRELAKAVEENPRCEPIATLFRAQQHLVRGRLAEAARDAAHVLSLESTVFRGKDSAWVVLADAHDRLGRTDEAIATTRSALAESPDLASHHLNLAALLGDASHRDAATRMNPWIGSPAILRDAAGPSIFRQQDALLARVDQRLTPI